MRSRYLLLASIIVPLASGCLPLASREQPSYGNQVGNSGPAVMTATLVTDTVAQVSALYPPTAAGFYLLQDAPDAFGKGLVQGLRQQGYQILSASDVVGPHLPPGLKLAYLVDAPPGTDVYRITVFIGPDSISRAYVPTATGAVAPAGPWSRRT